MTEPTSTKSITEELPLSVRAGLARRLGVTANAISQHDKRVRAFLEQQGAKALPA